MQGKIIDFSLGMNGKQRVTLELIGDFRETYDELKDCDVSVKIKKFRAKRSNEANAYAWILLDKLSAKLGIPKTELYRNTIKNIGGVSQIVCVQDIAVKRLRLGWEHNGIGWQSDEMPSKVKGCTNVILYYGSSTYDTAQMSRLIDLIVQDCKDAGIEVMPPEELARLMEGWK